MSKEKLLLQIGLEIDNLHAHVRRISKVGYALHSLDIDMLQQKMQSLYEMLFTLENFVETKHFQPTRHTVDINSADEPALAITPISRKENKTVAEKKITNSEQFAVPVVSNEVTKEIVTNPVETGKPIEEAVSTKEEPVERKQEPQPTKHKEEIKTTLDLFSDLSDETISDKLNTTDEASVADQMQKSHINDLRQAIGINEKFLFINELFSGDLSHYNKAIDELNSFINLDGAKTYLFELKVEKQWEDNSQALRKLNELLERKFS